MLTQDGVFRLVIISLNSFDLADYFQVAKLICKYGIAILQYCYGSMVSGDLHLCGERKDQIAGRIKREVKFKGDS